MSIHSISDKNHKNSFTNSLPEISMAVLNFPGVTFTSTMKKLFPLATANKVFLTHFLSY